MSKHKFKIPIGDWSDDGHGKCDEFIIECNYLVEDVQKAYKDSCKLTGVSFNHSSGNEDYTGLNRSWKESGRYEIATEYQDSIITEEVEEIFLKHGIDVRKDYDHELEEDEEKEEVWIGGSEHFIELLMKFIQLSLPDLEYQLVEDDLPYLNGYWGDLNVQFGYGLFS